MLKQLTKKKIYWNMQVSKYNSQNRKLDARKKIMLGGLFVKAGLDSFYPHDPATLYGMLLDAKEQLKLNPTLISKYKNLGKELIQF